MVFELAERFDDFIKDDFVFWIMIIFWGSFPGRKMWLNKYEVTFGCIFGDSVFWARRIENLQSPSV